MTPAKRRFLTELSTPVTTDDTFLGDDDPIAHEICAPERPFDGALTIQVLGLDLWDASAAFGDPAAGPAFVEGIDARFGTLRGRVFGPSTSRAAVAGVTTANGIARDGEATDLIGDAGAFQVATITVAPIPLPGAAPLVGGAGPHGRLTDPPAPGLIRGTFGRRVPFGPAASMFAADRTGEGAPMQLSGKTAVVTGSNSGIGLGIARELARAGAAVVLNSYTDTQDDHALAESVAREFGVEARYVQADLADGAAARRLVETAGACDILVNNAGIQHVAPIPDFPAARWDAVIAINLSSAFHTTAVALPMMREAGWGRVVNVASAHGLTASPYKSAYVAAKHGIVGLTKVTALETAEEPITANALCPGYVLTPLVEAQIPDTMKEYGMDRETVIREVMLARQPSKRFATVEQMGGTVVFLCSPAADQITGTTISVDGGWTAL